MGLRRKERKRSVERASWSWSVVDGETSRIEGHDVVVHVAIVGVVVVSGEISRVSGHDFVVHVAVAVHVYDHDHVNDDVHALARAIRSKRGKSDPFFDQRPSCADVTEPSSVKPSL